MSDSETTRLHFNLSSKFPLKNPMFSSNNNNNNRSPSSKPYKQQTGFSNQKPLPTQRQKNASGIYVKAQSYSCIQPSNSSRNRSLSHASTSNLKDQSNLSRKQGEFTDSISSDPYSTHPYKKEGEPKLRKPRRLSSNQSQQNCPLYSQSSHTSYISHLSQSSSLESPFYPDSHKRVAFFLEDERPELTIAERKFLLMNTSPHSCRSLTPQGSTSNSFPLAPKNDIEKGYESSSAYELQLPTETRSIGSPDYYRHNPPPLIDISTQSNSSLIVPPSSAAPEFDSICELEELTGEIKPNQVGTQSLLVLNSPAVTTCQLTGIRSKLSLTRRCSEATLPLSFSYKKHSKTIKLSRKPRISTSNSTHEKIKVLSPNSSQLNSEDLFENNEKVDSSSPTRRLFMNSKSTFKPRHSMYFLPYSRESHQPDKPSLCTSNAFSGNRNFFGIDEIKESESECHTTFTATNSLGNLIPTSTRSFPDKEDPPSSVSDSDTTEDSFFGEDTKFNKLHNPEFAASPNLDSEGYSLNNALHSQEYADISSSVDDVDCADGDLSDSGCHASEMAAAPFSTGPVIKVRLDLNKVKYVGLNLVGGIDSPFGELPVLVKEAMPGGSGELSGIRSGDEIIGINNVSLENKTLQFAVERLRQCSSRDQEIILWVIKKAGSC